jgi:two-component system, NarL family, invasion response regulator UvrY
MTTTKTKIIKVLIADDHAIVREGLKQILADTKEIVVAGLPVPLKTASS